MFNKLIDDLVRQSAKPQGFVGTIMTAIWSKYFKDLNAWGLSHLERLECGRILDIGFGGGSNIRLLKEKYPEAAVYGIDISEESLKRAEKGNHKWKTSGEVILSVADAAEMKFPDCYFDLVTAGQTHIYWVKPEQGLKECYRVLNKGGIFLITCETEKIHYHLPEYESNDDFLKLLSRIGFSQPELKVFGNYVTFICKKS